MPFSITPSVDCESCPHGYCVENIRTQSRRMKDRDTHYRLQQNRSMACTFEAGVPGFCEEHSPDIPFMSLTEKCVSNAEEAGRYIEAVKPEVFGEDIEASFFLTPGQRGKVKGDVFESLCRAVLWNCCCYVNGTFNGYVDPRIADLLSRVQVQHPISAITLGDNYALSELFSQEFSQRFLEFERSLADRGTSLCYSTPDLIVFYVKDDALTSLLTSPIGSLTESSLRTLSNVKGTVAGRLSPSDVLLASGLKTSIRSDRMYQFLFEANAWKAIWRKVYGLEPSKYYSVMLGHYGANPEKLKSVEFTSIGENTDEVEKAIDGFVSIKTPLDLVTWFVGAVEELS